MSGEGTGPTSMAERRSMLFFGLAYVAHGIAGGLAKQPFTYYVKVPAPRAIIVR